MIKAFKDIDYSDQVASIKKRVPALRSVLTKKVLGDLLTPLRSYAFFVSNLETISAVLFVKRSLEQAIERGESLKQWREGIRDNKEFKDQFNSLSKARLETIFRTNIAQAQNDGIREKAKILGRWIEYVAVEDSRVRASHLELNGIILPADDSFWDANMPIQGYNCRCTAVTHFKEDVQKTDKRTVENKLKAYKELGGRNDFARNSTQNLKYIKDYQKKRAEKAKIPKQTLNDAEKRNKRITNVFVLKTLRNVED